MQYQIARTYPHEIFNEESVPKVTIYFPTHRDPTKNEEDRIRFGNLIRSAEKRLEDAATKEQKTSITKTLSTMKDDRTLWNARAKGMGVFACEKSCVVYILQNPPRELLTVGERFHTKPLIRDFQGLDEYQVLTLDRRGFTVYEGNRTGFRKIPHGENEPKTVADFLGDEHTEDYLSMSSHGSTSTPMYHGQKSRKDEIDKDTERYLKLIDKHVLEHYSKPSEKPLILFALPEFHGFFKKQSKNPYLLKEGIRRSPAGVKEDELKEHAWQIIEPRYEASIVRLLKRYENAKQKGLASDDVEAVAKAAVQGRIEAAIVEAYRRIPGRIQEDKGLISYSENEDDSFGDVLDDLIDIVKKSGGEVVVLPKERMPVDAGVAAIYRY